jgi:hypothetical protein
MAKVMTGSIGTSSNKRIVDEIIYENNDCRR